MLNAHSAIAVPHPPHIMKLFSPVVPYYGSMATDRNFRLLINDVCRLVELHTYPWGIVLNREEVFFHSRDRNLLSIYFQLYDQYLAATGKRRWACKSTFMIEHVAQILHYHPDARFIFMVRDGRDVAVSAKSSIFNHFHVFYSAQRWQREQRVGLDWLVKLPPEQIMLLKYEELIADPESTLRRLCGFLGEAFEEQMLEYHRSDEAQKSGSLSVSWENTSRPVLRNNANKFRSQLSQREILLYEAIAHREMQELGYYTEHSLELLQQQSRHLTQEHVTYRLTELWFKIKAELNHLVRDKNSGARLQKNIYMASIRILRRLTSSHA